MDSLVLANITHRPTRTIVSVLGVSVGIIMVLLITGLASGMIGDRAKRDAQVGAEIIFRRSGSMISLGSALSVPVQYRDRLLQIEGVEEATPIGQYIQGGSDGLGFFAVEGIDYDSYARISGLQMIEGTGLQSDNDIIIDEGFSHDKKLHAGDKYELLGHDFRVAGVFSPAVGFRVKLRLSEMQKLLGAVDHCSVIYVKCKDSSQQDEVARRINQQLPDNQVVFTRDLPQLYANSFPALDTFIKVVVGVALVVSTLTILLAMYTSVTERTREIGILKALGASKPFIVFTIEKEALAISIFGVIAGYAFARLAQLYIVNATKLKIVFEPHWMIFTILVGLTAGLIGALYPAIRAACQDAVVALNYE